MALIEPVAGAPAPVEITPTEPQAESAPAEGGAELPDAILKIPVFGPLMAGAPGALSIRIADMAKTEEGKTIAENAKPLQEAGMFFYRALDKTTGVIGNGLYVTPEQIQQADQAGQLGQVAPEFNLVNNEAAKSGELNPVLNAQVPSGPPTAPAPAPPQMSAGTMPAPPPASTQTKLAGARSKNLQEGSPTSGRAAQGRLLNNLLKPAI